MTSQIVLNVLAAIFALVAAGLCLVSSWKPLPQQKSYYGHVPPTDPFFVAVSRANRFNRWAAMFAILAAISTVAALSLPT